MLFQTNIYCDYLYFGIGATICVPGEVKWSSVCKTFFFAYLPDQLDMKIYQNTCYSPKSKRKRLKDKNPDTKSL